MFFAVLFLTGYWGLHAHEERRVVAALVQTMVAAARPSFGDEPRSEAPVLVSRPMACAKEAEVVDGVPGELVSRFLASNEGARPVALTALAGQVAVLSQADTERLFHAGYRWQPDERTLVWVSRVGLDFLLQEALVCIGSNTAIHGRKFLIYLRKSSGEWGLVEQ